MSGIEATGVTPAARAVGDVVFLKSGGPPMTVVRVFKGGDGEDVASVAWFWRDKEWGTPTGVAADTFPVAALKADGGWGDEE